ncbi:MFS transporter [Streptomyces sp. NPDC060223]|uniref:MFS transporter n=1 Tax=unclassified Streptomyces TaxID=2593676 RepID=UPI00364500D6
MRPHTTPGTATPDTEPSGGPVRARSLRWITITLAFACGASVANLYYAQPLLSLIGRAFDVGQGTATMIVTATQVGYALGLALLLPLGDLLENRRLASRTLVLTAAALAVAAFAPTFWVFLAMSAIIGVTSVVAQILIPLAAHLAPPKERGKLVGQVTSGLLLGIMLARSVSSFAAAAWGWRSIYAISAVAMLITSFALAKMLVVREPAHTARYGALLASVIQLGRTEPILRRRALTQACLFGAFTAYWTAVTYELVERHHLSQSGVAVFALVGAAGAAAAPIAGRLGDAGHGTVARATALVLGLASMLVAGLGASSLIALALGGVLLDFAVQGHQVLSQRDIYAVRPDARARINSVYMTSVFLGGAISSAVTGAVFTLWGWSGVTVMAAALIAVGLVIWVLERRTARQATSSPAPLCTST